MLIFRKSNCISAASGIATLFDCSEHRLREESSRNLCTEQSPKEGDDTRCCTNTVSPPEDEHISARNL